ncbi:MAG: rhomboid family intramembrane serine protease [Chitinophagaceae bacterium]
MKVVHRSYKNKITLGQDNNSLVWLVAINGVMFVMVVVIKVIYQLSIDSNVVAEQTFYREFLQWLTLSSTPMNVITRPWTIFSYMFVHEGFWDLLSTLMWLWGFGYILQSLSGNNKMIPLYIYGGVIAAIVFVTGISIFPTLSHAGVFMGGSAAVLCIAIAATTLAPNFRIFPMISGGIPLWLLTAVFCIIDLMNISAGGPVLLAAHALAGLAGFIFITELNKGRDWSAWMNRFAYWFDNLFKPETKPMSQKLFYKANREPFVKINRNSQQNLDEILDKINQKGLSSLTDEERNFLDQASQQDL